MSEQHRFKKLEKSDETSIDFRFNTNGRILNYIAILPKGKAITKEMSERLEVAMRDAAISVLKDA